LSSYLNELSSNAFEDAIKKGQGRALYHALTFGIEEVADILLNACTSNQIYDAQCESSRARWLLRMFHDTPFFSYFSQAIVEALHKAEDFWDIQQLCGLAEALAQYGNDSARQALKSTVLKHLGGQDLGTNECINLEGVEGLLEIARLNGQRYLSDPNYLIDDSLLHDFSDDPRLESFTQSLLHHAQEDNAVRAYLEYLKQREQFPPFKPRERRSASEIEASQRKGMRESQSIATILEDAKAKRGTIPGRYAIFGKLAATREELEELFLALINEPDDEVCLRLLWVFSLTPLPRLDNRLWGWVNHSDDELRWASLRALSHIQSDEVHKYARAKLKAGWILGANVPTIALLRHNFEPDDGVLLFQALELVQSSWDEMHEMGYYILAVSAQQKHPSLSQALYWVYENTPCSNCRRIAVTELRQLGLLSKDILLECLYDADEELRSIAQEQLVKAFGYSTEQLFKLPY
jgi:tellurite resistance protein